MRVYHFIESEYGLKDLREQRLKIATLNELNDPFELYSLDLSEKYVRRAFQKLKDTLARNFGLLCFSRTWRNPVVWSHYADKHAGLCLGFDVPDGAVTGVSYSRHRLVAATDHSLALGEFSLEVAKKFLFTKYSHWHYENEVRWLLPLGPEDQQTKLYYANFSQELRLAQVVVGALAKLRRAEINNVLGELAPGVQILKARLAFKSFRVVRQHDPSVWS